MSGWKPVDDNTPRNGTKIDLWFAYPRGRTIDCFWGECLGEMQWIWKRPRWEGGRLLPKDQWDTCCYPNMEPTHWMPAPEPPEPDQ